jgi:hypothetical protein
MASNHLPYDLTKRCPTEVDGTVCRFTQGHADDCEPEEAIVPLSHFEERRAAELAKVQASLDASLEDVARGDTVTASEALDSLRQIADSARERARWEPVARELAELLDEAGREWGAPWHRINRTDIARHERIAVALARVEQMTEEGRDAMQSEAEVSGQAGGDAGRVEAGSAGQAGTPRAQGVSVPGVPRLAPDEPTEEGVIHESRYAVNDREFSTFEVRARQSGKTTDLLAWVADAPEGEHRVFVTHSKEEAMRVYRENRDRFESWQFVGIDEVKPGAWAGVIIGRGGRVVLGLDNFDLMLERLVGRPVGKVMINA